jgi:hypothetical protein
LLGAVLERMLSKLADYARERASESDVGAAFFGVLEHAIAQSSTKSAIADGLGGGLERRKRAWAGGLREAIAVLLARAQAAGAVRKDVEVPDVMAILVAATRAIEYAGADQALRARTTRVLLDGLRPRVSQRTTRSVRGQPGRRVRSPTRTRKQ